MYQYCGADNDYVHVVLHCKKLCLVTVFFTNVSLLVLQWQYVSIKLCLVKIVDLCNSFSLGRKPIQNSVVNKLTGQI